MRRFTPHRNLRTTVWVVLGAWLLALAAGMANACVLAPQLSHDHGGHEHSAHPHGDHAGALLHSDSAPAHDHQSKDASKATCAKACAESAQSLLYKVAATTFSQSCLPPPLYSAWTPAQSHDPNGEQAWSRVQVPPDPPPRLRFARLAL